MEDQANIAWSTQGLIWYGTESIFQKLGFKKVGTTKSRNFGKHRVIMRYFCAND